MAGYEYDRREILPGDSLAVTLFWQSLQDVSADYVMQVRLLDEAGNIVATADGRPVNGTSLTNTWEAGKVFEDTHILEIEPGTPAGAYQVEIAVFDPESGRRLNIIAEDGHWIDSRLLLAPLRAGSDAKEWSQSIS